MNLMPADRSSVSGDHVAEVERVKLSEDLPCKECQCTV